VLDLLSEGRDPEIATVRSIHRMKTAALIRASILLGAVASRAPKDAIERLDHFGWCTGLAFQIVDDVLDEEGDAATLGKTAGKDKEQRKMTYPACLGVDASRREADALIAEALGVVAPVDTQGELAALARFICSRQS
jgi:geranylgeranyl pyrophosphate synthase